MAPPRGISRYFKPPAFLQQNDDRASETPAKPSSPAPESSPLTELSSSFFLSNHASPQGADDSASQLKRSLMRAAEYASDTPSEHEREQLGPLDLGDEVVAVPPPPHGGGASFDHAPQRIVKNGKEVVISSDGEETDSVVSLEDPEALFLKFAKPSAVPAREKETDDDVFAASSRRSKVDLKGGRFGKGRKAPKVYKNTMDTLVTRAVDDNETEASVAKLKATFERDRAPRDSTSDQPNHLDENVLTSALGEQDDEMEMRRLLDAVRRTEAFDLEKIWTFFDYESGVAPALEFPRGSVKTGTYMSTLREPDSRERAFYSGILDFALSRGFLPDDILLWIFHSVPSEPREGLRHAYCRSFKHSKKERVESLIRPDTIDVLFERLGATKEALAVSDPVVPHTLPKGHLPTTNAQHQTALLSVLELLSGIADLLSDDTREHALLLLFRLTLDISLTNDPAICSALERTIHDLFQGTPEEADDDLELRLFTTLHTTIKDTILQTRLLKHMLPSTSHIAKWRSRLSLSFIMNSPSPLSEEDPEIMDTLQQIITLLKDPRFNIKQHKGAATAATKNRHNHPATGEYDYNDLAAITYQLNVILDSGWSSLSFPSKEAKQAFNASVDVLADRIKKIFTSIEDSGASHLKRTLTKGALEALHYRVVYAVRTKPPPKRTLFESVDTGQSQGQKKMTQIWKGVKIDGEEGIPIRGSQEVQS
ncbi:uncharacterized protein KD926_011057 [Aspergillus affinis]|uniref:uncharacterized protein n=1 Tax=Aspergillus affinis TaxID=1070780 RepID=UPI0022FDE7FE|nr:uncharacterized protein KD926_011057 [Aspergillus affinis]KAI9044884.1 hypothetical protein KD926_011057 [Aspergillus affinis]